MQTLLRLLQTFERAFVLRDRLLLIIPSRCLRFLHFVSSLIELPAQLLHLRVAAFTRQSFEFARSFACFFDQFLLLSLITAGSVCWSTLLTATLFFERLLLASRKFFQATFGFALLLLSLLLGVELDRRAGQRLVDAR
mgnify:CR=1 FL=1